MNEKILEERKKKKFYNSTKEERSKMLDEFFEAMNNAPTSNIRKVKYKTSVIAYILCLFGAVLILVLCVIGVIK
jgi:type IV secretory pathway component VirB8